jgi:hypothetical protein
MAREQVMFSEVDMSTLTNSQQEAWDYYMEAKQALGVALNASAPQGKKIVFTTKYNVLKVALVNRAQAKDNKPKISLGQWQDGQDQDGLRR